MYIQNVYFWQFVCTKRHFLLDFVCTKHHFVCTNSAHFLWKTWAESGQSDHKMYIQTQNVHTKMAFFIQNLYVHFHKSGQKPKNIHQKWAEMYIQIFAILYYSVCTKYRLYNIVKPFRKTSLHVFPVFSHTSRTILNSSALILTLISLLP